MAQKVKKSISWLIEKKKSSITQNLDMNSWEKRAKTHPKSGFYSTTIFPGTRACKSRETGILEITFSREIPGREIPGGNTNLDVAIGENAICVQDLSMKTQIKTKKRCFSKTFFRQQPADPNLSHPYPTL